MTPDQYQMIWNDKEKWIGDDILFVASKDCSQVLEFDKVIVTSTTPWQITLNGRYDCRTGECTFNFVAAGIGAFARFDVRGNPHRDAGRNHQHMVKNNRDVAEQLPYARSREDLAAMAASELWQQICVEAHIAHTGDFWEPEVSCE